MKRSEKNIIIDIVPKPQRDKKKERKKKRLCTPIEQKKKITYKYKRL